MKNFTLVMCKEVWRHALAVLIIMGFVFNGMALAREQSSSDIAGQRTAFEIEAVTVTAQKQEENIQDVPVSMTVLDAIAIEDAKIESILDLGDFIPNFHIFEAGNSGINPPTTRGLYAPMETGTVTTGLFVDGVPIFSSSGFDASFLGIERVEVLRGPQGTLYGKGAEAGVINIITRQPGNEFTGKISVDGGRWLSSEADDWITRTSAYLSGPVVENKLFFGLSGKFASKEGFIQDITSNQTQNDRSNWYGKINMVWQATDKLDVSVFASRKRYDDDAGQQSLSAIGAAGFGVSAPPHRSVTCNLPDEFYKITQDLQALKINYHFNDKLALSSITTNLRQQGDVRQDFDFTPFTFAHTDIDPSIKRTSQEFRLSYAKERLKWLAGIYYETDELEDERSTDSMMPSWVSTSHRIQTGDTYAAFTHMSYPVTEALSLTAGLRYEVEDRAFEDRVAGVSISESWDALSPKFAVEYKFTPEIMTYASAAMGYRSGGFNVMVSSAPEYYHYDPEKLWSYEMGIKTSLLGNKLIFNSAVFYMDIQDMQVTETLPSGMALLVNAAGATSKGIEMDLRYNATRELSFMAGFGYTDISYDNFSDVAGDYSGNKGIWSPEYTFNLTGQYRHPKGWFFRVDLIGCGKTYFDKDNTYSRDPYEVVNAKIGYEQEKFDIYLYGKNIFDRTYDATNVWGGFSEMYSEPGVIGLQANSRF